MVDAKQECGYDRERMMEVMVTDEPLQSWTVIAWYGETMNIS